MSVSSFIHACRYPAALISSVCLTRPMMGYVALISALLVSYQASAQTAPLPNNPSDAAVDYGAWESNDWQLVKPEVSLMEIGGYFRMRGDLLRRLDFGNGASTEVNPRYTAAESDGTQLAATYSSTNMRLRLTPIVNISDTIHVVTSFDIFDNLVMGSTPDIFPAQNSTPNELLSRRQVSPRGGSPVPVDTFLLKQAYGRVLALNEQLELRFGRMPNPWGLGMYANAGDCLDCDYGSVVDRIQVRFRAMEHRFTPMFDWVTNGPVVTPFSSQGAQTIDAAIWDDVVQYGLQIEKTVSKLDIKEKLMQGESVLNYGIWNMLRRQSSALRAGYYTQNDPTGTAPVDLTQPIDEIASGPKHKRRSDANLYIGDIYMQYYAPSFEFFAEAATIFGTFTDYVTNGDGGDAAAVSVFQYGATLDARYLWDSQDRNNALFLRSGAASGDSAPGFGALSLADSQRGPGDSKLNNFQFSPDKHVDLLLFRHIIGTVTDAWYVSPGVDYIFNERVKGKFWGTYSQAFKHRSTPSCYNADKAGTFCKQGDIEQGDLPLGIELDGELAYSLQSGSLQSGSLQSGREGSGFKAALAGGILFPLAGMYNNNLKKDLQMEAGSFAWALESRLYITF